MMRALIEFLFVVILAMVARAILMSVARGVGQASSSAFQKTAAEAERRRREGGGGGSERATAEAGSLRKDPVCGTYVAESTPFTAVRAGERLYFCSASCQEQFVPVPHRK